MVVTIPFKLAANNVLLLKYFNKEGRFQPPADVLKLCPVSRITT